MKTSSLTILFFLIFSLYASGQNLDRYNYVEVPERFEFFEAENKYQLNALTAFLFEKYGFEALYQEEEKLDLDPCEVLSAKVFDESNWFRTKIYFTLQDCEGKELFRSQTGVSKIKKFKDSYQEALREAFQSLQALNHQYDPALGGADKQVEPSSEEEVVTEVQEEVPVVIVDPVVSAKDMEKVEKAQKTKPAGEKESLKFTNGTDVYELRKTAVGFDLFKENSNDRFAKLVKTGGAGSYLYSSEEIKGSAFFDGNNNLVVEFLNEGTGQLLQLIYRSVDQ
jgi:hypothetical protein